MHTTIPLQCHIPLKSIPSNIQKQLDKREKYLNSLGVQFKKTEVSTDTESEQIMSNESQSGIIHMNPNELLVGKLYQYPHFSHHNLSLILQIFAKKRLTRQSWAYDPKMQQKFGAQITTAIDYFPFKNTFPENAIPLKHKKTDNTNKKTTKKNKKKKNEILINDNTTNKAQPRWQMHRKGYEFEGIVKVKDSFDSVMPFLTRNINNNSNDDDGDDNDDNDDDNEQELLIFRDNSYDIANVSKLKKMLARYNPDCIVIECAHHPFIADTYVEKQFSYRYLKLAGIASLSAVIPTQFLQTRIGAFFYNYASKHMYDREMASYATQTAIDCASKHSTPLICGDMHDKYFDTLRVFTEYLDFYNKATLIHYGLINEKFFVPNIHRRLTLNVNYLLGNRLNPHLTTLNSYRNDIFASVINELELSHHKILLVSGISRLNDLFDKLCGHTDIHQWIESVDDDKQTKTKTKKSSTSSSAVGPGMGMGMGSDANIVMKSIPRIRTSNLGISNTKFVLSEEEIVRCCQYLGFHGTAFLLLPEFQNDLELPSKRYAGDENDGSERDSDAQDVQVRTLIEKINNEATILEKTFSNQQV